MEPLITIIIPCYNQAAYLYDAAASIIAQTYTHWECILINDGSTDNTEALAEKWCTKDKRFRYVAQKNAGVSAARNAGLLLAKGAFIQFLDADDVLAPTKLTLSIAEIHQEPNTAIVYTNFEMFVNTVSKTSQPYCRLSQEMFNFEHVLYEWNNGFSIPIHCGLFKKTLFETVTFPTQLTAQEDWVVWVQVFKGNPGVIFINKPLAFYRRNPFSRTSTRSMLDDQMGAIAYFKTILTAPEYDKLTVTLLRRNYSRVQSLLQENRELREMEQYRLMRFFKKVKRKFNLN